MSEPGEDQTTNNNLPNPYAAMLTPEMDAKEAYFACLREWTRQAYMAQTAMPMWCCPSCSWPMNVAPVAPTPQPQSQPEGLLSITVVLSEAGNVNNEPGRTPISRTLGGFQYSVSSITKRLLAEMIDIFVTFFIKAFLMIMLLNFVEIEFGREEMQMALEEGFALDFSRAASDLLMFDLVVTLLACLFESAWTSVTPGNYIMQMRVLKVKKVIYTSVDYEPDYEDFVNFQINEPLQVLIFPIETPSVLRMFVRAVLKHCIIRAFFNSVLLAILLPLSVVVLFYNFNRSIHDVLTSTIVVDKKQFIWYRFQTPMEEED